MLRAAGKRTRARTSGGDAGGGGGGDAGGGDAGGGDDVESGALLSSSDRIERALDQSGSWFWARLNTSLEEALTTSVKGVLQKQAGGVAARLGRPILRMAACFDRYEARLEEMAGEAAAGKYAPKGKLRNRLVSQALSVSTRFDAANSRVGTVCMLARSS